MIIKVISLSRSTERREHFKKNNSHLNYAFFDAIDGTNLNDTKIKESGIFAPSLNYTKGAYGCALSHTKLWNECIHKNEPITIAEDDAIFRQDFSIMQHEFIKKLPKDWDFILWGWNFDFWLQLNFMSDISPAAIKFDQQQLRKNLDKFQQNTDPTIAFPLDKAWGIPAYTISPKGAKAFLEICTPLRPLEIPFNFSSGKLENTGIDSQMNIAYPQTLSYAAFPPLVVTPNLQSTSTIQTNQKNWLSRQAKKIKNLYKK